MIRNHAVSFSAGCVVLSILCALPAGAGDLLIFPSVTSVHQSEQDTELAAKEFLPAVDFFYTNDFKQARFLGEFLKSSREAELERFEFGWRILPGKTLWVGRFHNMLSFWNTQMHHGDFMQSSLSRPTVANYEDEHGPLPAHISGMMLESSSTVNDAEINYMAGFGVGPVFSKTLQPFDLLDPSANLGKIAGSFRFGYHPEAGNPNQFGAALGYARIPIVNPLLDPVNNVVVNEIRQTAFSAFVNYEHDRFHLMGELFVFDDRVSGSGIVGRYHTLSAYLQPEYKLDENATTTVYGRIESTPKAAYDGYLSLLPEFSPHQGVAGLRYDFSTTQAIKVELGRATRQDGLEFNSISAQWSMVLPL